METGEEVHPGLAHIALGLVRRGIDRVARVPLRVLALHPGNRAELALHRDTAAVGHLDHRTGARDVLLQ
jgi:hypothetical protein